MQLALSFPCFSLPFCPWRDGGVEVALSYSLRKVAMLFLVGDCYSGCLWVTSAPDRACGWRTPPKCPPGIGSPWDLVASLNLPPLCSKRLHTSIVYASFSHIVESWQDCVLYSYLCIYQLLELEGMYRIHLTTNIPLQNLELLGHRQVEVEWGVRGSSTFLSLLR